MKWVKVGAGIYRSAEPGPDGQIWRISRFANDYWELWDGRGNIKPCLSYKHAKSRAADLMGKASSIAGGA